jgi:hypothetical protein
MTDHWEIGCGQDSMSGPIVSSCENGNEPSSSTKDGNILNVLSSYQTAKEVGTPYNLFSSISFKCVPHRNM